MGAKLGRERLSPSPSRHLHPPKSGTDTKISQMGNFLTQFGVSEIRNSSLQALGTGRILPLVECWVSRVFISHWLHIHELSLIT